MRNLCYFIDYTGDEILLMVVLQRIMWSLSEAKRYLEILIKNQVGFIESKIGFC